jgi:ankyrin repeat protein
MRSFSTRSGLLLAVLGLAAGQAAAQNLPTDQGLSKMNIRDLIDKLQEVAEGDTGYLPTQSGSGFLPLGTSQAAALLLGQKPPARSDTLRELVKRGAAAVPHLIAHLDDQRPTKITIRYRSALGGMYFVDEYDYNSRTAKQPPEGVNRRRDWSENDPDTHTVTVGDLCFVALGQIVNRRFSAVRYQPTACIMINSPTRSEALRRAVKKEWGDLTPEQHKKSLVRDFLDPDSEYRRTDACLRLGYYYPDALEPLALKQLAAPRYDVFEVQALVRKKLYRTEDVNARKELFDAFVARRGEVARQGILVQLFGDLDTQEADERRALSPPLREKHAARACLIELYGYPKEVKSKDRPHLLPTGDTTQARFVDALAFFPSAKIDQAVREILRSTDDYHLANACARYLVGRGADEAIRQYVEQRLKGADAEQRKWLERMRERLGWTRLHVAAEVGEPEQVEGLILRGADVNARAANGQTPLHVAAAHGSCGAIGVLLDRKADPNLKDRQGQTPVQLAVGEDPVVELLLAGGAEASDILVASSAGRADLVRAFLAKDKALVGVTTASGETPLHLAARLGHRQVAELLLTHGADVNARDSSKLTPLHWAASYARADVVALLLAHKADRGAKSWDGKTPWDYAQESEDEKTIRLLEKDR